MTLSIVIVSYNVSYFLEQTLRSVQKAIKSIDAEVFVVDNNSADNSVEMVKNKFPFCTLIANTENVGFSRANNQAIRQSTGAYILLLNPDTVIQDDTLIKCVDYLNAHPEAGGLGVYMVDGSGNYLPESKRGLPTPWVALYKVIGLSFLFKKHKLFGKYHLGYLDKNQIHEVDVLSGAFMFLRKSVLDKIGLLDEDFFMYGEDIDLSYRITKAGYKNIYFPETQIIHYKGESTKKSSINYVFVFYRAMVIFARKHFTMTHAGLFSLLIHVAIYARAFLSILTRALKAILFPAVCFTMIFAGFVYLKNFWEVNYKHLPGLYPAEYLMFVVPMYIVIWLTSVYYSGGFDHPFKSYKIVRGVFWGTLLISAFSNFVDDLRFSKALIILGAIWSVISIIILRYLFHYLQNRNFKFEGPSNRKIIIIGSEIEFIRVSDLVSKSNTKSDVIGFIGFEMNTPMHDHLLGNISKVKELMLLYKPDEVIFCSKNVPAGQIIELMALIDTPSIDFKMVPDEGNFIIGSNSRDTNGQFYTMDVHLSIKDRHNIRNKRVLDLVLSLLFLILTPVLIWGQFNKKKYVYNLLLVLFGTRTFVGYAGRNFENLPSIKKGILNTISEYAQPPIDETTIKRLNMLYAKDYTSSTDLQIIFSSLSKIGN
ncbi:MAG: glycosyltransferase family 2 protein [Bacteroidota bacterium]|nr:glycosyltransferase family 2 protein [Bacteroidota bacterium]